NFAQILTIEFKKDIIPEYDKNTSISKLHEKLHESSNKNQILFYSSKNIGFNNGIVIKPIAKTTGKSYIIYSKLAELKAHKSSNPTYFEQFELQYLEEIKNLLRFEVRFVKFADLKKALQLSNRKEIYAKDVFFSKINVVQNEFEKFLK
ncbi:hypothetical protein J6A31_03245, partial [bacterium]|nr:hypothetical protein [bacterium]